MLVLPSCKDHQDTVFSRSLIIRGRSACIRRYPASEIDSAGVMDSLIVRWYQIVRLLFPASRRKTKGCQGNSGH